MQSWNPEKAGVRVSKACPQPSWIQPTPGWGGVGLHASFDAHAVAAYYTPNAVRLYRHAGFPPAEIHFTPEISALWDAGRAHEAGQRFIEHVLKEREEFDRLEAEYRARPRPGFR